MKLNRTLVMAVSIVVAAALTIGGTLAYMTDTESAINVMTAGRVDVELIEQQRNEEGTALEDFEDGKKLMPMDGPQGAEDKDEFGMPNNRDYLDKIISAKNTNMSSDAWMRILVALPSELDQLGNAGNNILHFNFANRFYPEGNSPAGDVNPEWAASWDTSRPGEVVTIDGVNYNVYVFTHKTIVEPGQTVFPVVQGFYLDARVDYDGEKGCFTFDGKELETDLSNLEIPVMVQAVQASGFDTAEEAFLAAGFDAKVNGTVKLARHWDEVESYATVSDLTSLKAALATNQNVTLTEDIDANTTINVPAGVVFDGNGKTLTNVRIQAADGATIENVKFDKTSGEKGSFIYASGNVTIENCEFTEAAWDCIQLTPAAGKVLVVKNNIFNGPAYRCVHVEVTDTATAGNADNGIKLILTGNTFNKITECSDDGITIAGVFAKNITLGGNTTDVSAEAFNGEVWTGVRNGAGNWEQYNINLLAQ